MRSLAAAALVALAPAAFAADAPARKGIETGDLDRAVAPCTDFYEFANGSWRAANPIPPSMVRWSRRWAAGETAKDQLNAILDQVSARTDWPKGSVEQLVGDHYGSCMDEARVEALGVEPIKPLLAEIEALADIAGVQKMIGRFHELAIPVPFGLTASSDNHQPTQVIADVYASGLGLPDRDYYVKTEPRFQDAREKYRVHVAHLIELSGKSRADSRRAAEAVFGMEKQLAVASLDNVGLRDPKATDHKTSFVALTNLAPDFDWPGYFAAAKLPRAALNVQQPEFLKAMDRLLLEDAPRLLEGVPPLAPRPVRGPLPLRGLRPGELRLRGAVPRRGEGDEAALEALRRSRRTPPRRGPRPQVRREALPAGSEGPHAGAREEPAPRHGRHHPGARVDGAGDEGEGPREARDLQPEDRLSRQVEGLLRRPHQARRLLGERGGRAEVQRGRRPDARSASRWTAAGGG